MSPPRHDMEPQDAVVGALLGCAAGDALGLPYEGLSRKRAARLLGDPTRHRFLFGRGMVSDDTEHTCMVAQAMCAFPDDPHRFAAALARRLRWWLLGLPAGIGWATLRALIKSWIGFGPARSGVFSAGNGPAMRSAILGAAINDIEKLRNFVRASTLITHTDPKAMHGALAVALAAFCARRKIEEAFAFIEQHRAMAGADTSDEFNELLQQVSRSVTAGESTEDFAASLGDAQRVSGYVYRTVPVALHAWLKHPRDFEKAVTSAIRCGGDTDTVAAITGAIVGCGCGEAGIRQDWIERLWAWPRTKAWMRSLGAAMAGAGATGAAVAPPRAMPVVGVFRNLFFLAIVLTHGLRRLLPPY